MRTNSRGYTKGVRHFQRIEGLKLANTFGNNPASELGNHASGSSHRVAEQEVKPEPVPNLDTRGCGVCLAVLSILTGRKLLC